MSSLARISTLSTEYVRIPITGREEGVLIDPTSLGVEVAFTDRGTDPTEDDWREADWESNTHVNPTKNYARCLVGPDGTGTLTADTYQPWVRIAGPDPEIPVIKADGLLRVF